MSISPDYCRKNPEWAARRIDELEAQLREKFFAATPDTPVSTHPYDNGEGVTQERLKQALAFSDALDYAHGFTQWVDTMKALAWAVRQGIRPRD